PAAGDRRHHEVDRPGLGQFELHRVPVARVDLADRLEQDAARDADAFWRLGDAVEGGLDVLGRQLGAVMELDALAQKDGVGFAILRYLPAMREGRDDRPAGFTRVATMPPRAGATWIAHDIRPLGDLPDWARCVLQPVAPPNHHRRRSVARGWRGVPHALSSQTVSCRTTS